VGRGDRLGQPQAAGESSSSSATASTETTEPTSEITEPTSIAPTTRGHNPIPRVIQWINEVAPLGGGADGIQEEAFHAMLDGNCAQALKLSEITSSGRDRLGEPSRTLYEAAASACLAAFEPRPELWPRAEAAFRKLANRTSRLDCQEQTVYRLAKRLIDLHRAYPDTRLVRRASGKRGVLRCPRFTAITPNHGPPEGGYTIRLEGVNLPRVVGLNFGPEHHRTAVSQDGRHVVITVPPKQTPDVEVWIWPDGWPFGYAFNVAFYYDPPDTTRPPSATTKQGPTTTTKQPTSTLSPTTKQIPPSG
jgi:IPT/TIG domain